MKGRYKRPLTRHIIYVDYKEKSYKRNIMFLFAGHSDKPLKSLISIAHEENNICLHDFSFSLHCECLVGGRLYMPDQRMNCTTKSAIYVVELRLLDECL